MCPKPLPAPSALITAPSAGRTAVESSVRQLNIDLTQARRRIDSPDLLEPGREQEPKGIKAQNNGATRHPALWRFSICVDETQSHTDTIHDRLLHWPDPPPPTPA